MKLEIPKGGHLIEVFGYNKEDIKHAVNYLVETLKRKVVSLQDLELNALDDMEERVVAVDLEDPILHGGFSGPRKSSFIYLVRALYHTNTVFIVPHLREFWDYDPFDVQLHRSATYVVRVYDKGFVMRDYLTDRRYVHYFKEQASV